jgi:mitogen-activated protein kinase kinase kinase
MAGFIPSPSETETDNSSDNYAEVSEETSQVRFGWQNMLESVVQGDIFKGEKLRISEAITGEADWELLHDQIWLELRAKLHGRTVDGERTHIAHRRLDTHDAAIQSIIDFQAEDNQTSVPSQVEQVLTALARAKSYYPSIEAFWRDKPSGLDSTMRERQDALCAWSNATLLIRNIQPRIYFWSEDDLHEDMPMAATWTESPRNEERTPEELRAHLVLKRHSIRILQNASLLQHFEQTFMSIIPRIITKARNDQLDYGHLLNEMHLPRLEETIIPLVRFPFDFITMLLRMQSRHVRSFRTPNAIMIDELAEQLREKIGLACALVPIYEPLVQSSLGGFWTMPQKADSSYDHAVLEAVQCLFNLMETKLKLMAPDRFFHEADLLVSQQTVLADVGGRIEHGFMFVSEQLWYGFLLLVHPSEPNCFRTVCLQKEH